jgi:hypothetical protein
MRTQNTLSDPILVRNAVRQGVVLACLLFNIALEKVIRDASLNTRGTVFYKSVQIVACADVINIIGRTQTAVKEAFINLEKAANRQQRSITCQGGRGNQCYTAKHHGSFYCRLIKKKQNICQ